MKITNITCAALALTLTSFTHAQAADVRFNGLVEPVCTLIVNSDGTLRSSSDGKVLGSKENGGVAAAVVAVSNTNQLAISAAAPSAFTSAPSGGDTTANFAVDFTAAGLGTNIPGTTPTALPIGVTALSIDLTATKTAGTFPAGDYVADVTVTCE